MNDEKDNNAEIYSEIAAALDLHDDAPKEKILEAIAILKKRTAAIIDDPDISIVVIQILVDAEAGVAANVKIDLSALKAKIVDALLRWLDERGLVTLTKIDGVVDNVVPTKHGLDILSKGMIDAEVTAEHDRSR